MQMGLTGRKHAQKAEKLRAQSTGHRAKKEEAQGAGHRARKKKEVRSKK